VTSCDRTLGGLGGLRCTDESGEAHTHVFEASDAVDRHDATEGRDD
jgi:hypothetical protein